MSQQHELTESITWRAIGRFEALKTGNVLRRSGSVFNTNGRKKPQYERHSIAIAPSEGYWYQSLNSNCSKPTPSCWFVYSQTYDFCFINREPPCCSQKVGTRASQMGRVMMYNPRFFE
ncbi:hypothetical protein AVEN_129149-1 [Araneus ventricosus]|uniref:Uncharacterized protein n=1 Tax=Araneus ventricosus TaxID=182803 RepID=A0A4Y2N6G8_ARAVE|nr:hypothetical protein AVEN_129149-1 [Araneus ventricosus]